MRNLFFTAALVFFFFESNAQVTIKRWVSTDQSAQWHEQTTIPSLSISKDTADVEILLNKPLQQVEGFGTCFNELGWGSLSLLSESDRESVMKEMFAPGKGANFTICRMPVGANDFSNDWYSYNESDGDFAMTKFDISHDLKTIVPFIKNALKYNPNLKLWASPWSPPTWMKYNKQYASVMVPNVSSWPEKVLLNLRNDWGIDFKNVSNGLTKEQEVREGVDNFKQDEQYFKSYSLYFTKFIQAYRNQHIKIGMVMPQNEFNSPQVFPSCTWTAGGLSRFLKYLVPAMQAQQVDVFFGTMERPGHQLVDSILNDPSLQGSIKGVGFQWAGKDAIPAVHNKYPHLTLYQTEQECGNGYNDWKYCKYAWGLMKHYFKNGANAYMYWNTSLKEGGRSTWGWHQNSLVSVDTLHRSYKFNYEYFLLKHVSHFVKPGAKRLETSGVFENLLAFVNLDKSIVLVVYNESLQSKMLHVKIGDRIFSPHIKADSFNTFCIQ